MKVGLFIASDEWGGAEDSFVAIANEMARQRQVMVILLRGNVISDQFDARVEVRIIDAAPSRFNPFLYMALIQAINAAGLNIIHTHGAKATRLVHRVRNLISATHVATKHNARRGKVFNRVKHVTAVSQAAVDSVTHGNAELIHNGIVKKTIEAEANDIFTIRAIGRLEKVKQYDQLITAVKDLEFPFVLEIAGEGSERERLEQLIEAHKLASKVTLLGYRNNTGQLIAGSDLLVICSLSEGFSMVLVEALFYGKVLISSYVGGSTEVLSKKLLFNQPGLMGRIRDVHDHYDSYRKEFAGIQAKYNGCFEIDKIVDKYLAYYDAVLLDD